MHIYAYRLMLILNSVSSSDVGLQANIPRRNTSSSEPSKKGLRSLKNVVIDYRSTN